MYQLLYNCFAQKQNAVLQSAGTLTLAYSIKIYIAKVLFKQQDADAIAISAQTGANAAG